jgi:hypothetical protein
MLFLTRTRIELLRDTNQLTRQPMRFAAWFIIITALCTSMPVQAQSSDDALRVYAVNVVKTPPFEKQFTGYGIYLGHGTVITAAHVVGHWPIFTHPRVLIGGLDLPAKVIKEGSLEQTDLALLSVDQAQLPISLRLRRNPLCNGPPLVGTNVIVVYPERTVRSQIISPLLIAPRYRVRFGALISDAEGSGSGVFHAESKCLLGIISRKIQKYNYRDRYGHAIAKPIGFAGYFVPASQIADFIPPESRF